MFIGDGSAHLFAGCDVLRKLLERGRCKTLHKWEGGRKESPSRKSKHQNSSPDFQNVPSSRAWFQQVTDWVLLSFSLQKQENRGPEK